MGLEIVVENESGVALASWSDPTNILHKVLPAAGDVRFHHLNHVDLYGDTSFNRLQVPAVLDEIRLILSTISSPDEVTAIERLKLLAEQALAEPHLYLKFYGD